MKNVTCAFAALCFLVPRLAAADITTGLVGRWALDATSGTTADDSSGFNNNGTLVNGPAWNSGGKLGGALSFDGVNDYVTLGNPASLIPGSTITLASWMRLTDISANRFVISKYDGLSPQTDTFLRYQVGTGVMCSIGGTAVVAAVSVVTGQWYHVACTYDGALIRVYLDGVQVKTLAKTGPIADEVGTPWLLGARTPANPGAFMHGLLDDVRIYTRALAGPDVTELFNFAGPDVTPPVRSNGAPSGTLASGTTQTTLSLSTNESATCRYSTSAGTAYASMANVFSTTGGTSHSTVVTGLSNGNAYAYYVRCQDASGNANTVDYSIAFSVASPQPPGGDITTGLKGHWTFDDGFGTTATDSSGSNNNGTLINGPAWNAVGKIGGALSFDGVNDFVTLSNPASLIPGNTITLAGWMKVANVTGNKFIISKYNGVGPQNDTFLRVQAGTGLMCSVGGTSTIGSASVVAGPWYHAACTYDGSLVRVYLDGVQIATVSKSGPIADEAGTAWLIGARTPANPGAFMAGLLDDVRVYDRALTPADMTLLVNSGGGPPPTDTTPPVLTNGAPTGTLPAGTTQTTLSVTTNENAVCRYSTTPGTTYASMTGTFSVTGATSHSTTLVNLANGSSYTRYLRCQDAAGNANVVDYAISFSVGGPPTDTTPPVLSNGAPTGVLPSGTTQTTMSLTTSENADCRYSTTPGTSYASMTGTFALTGTTTHSTTLTALVDGNSYTRYVRCRDAALNANSADYAIAFSVATTRFLTASSWASFTPAANGVGTLPKGFKQGVFDGRYAYFVPNFQGNSQVMRYDTTASFTAASSWTTFDPNPPSGGGYVGGAFDGRYVYFAPYHNGSQSIGEVLRYDTQSPFTSQASWSTFNPGANGVGTSPRGYWGAFFDGRYVYFSPEWQNGIQEHGEVLRYDTTSPFNQAASWKTYDASAHGVGTDADGYKGIASDGTYLYFVPYYNGTASHGEVLRYDRRVAFDVASSWATFTPAANGVGNIAKGFEDALFDGRYLYFVPSYAGVGANAYHGEVLRYDTLAPFQTASSWAAFDPGSNGVGVDPDGYHGATFDGRYIYFAPSNNGSGPHGEVLMYDTTKPFNSPGSWLTYDPGAHGIGTDPDGFAATIFDGQYIYFVPDRNESGVPSGEVLRYDTGALIQTTTLAPATGPATSPSLVLQAVVPAAPIVSEGRLFAEVDGAVNTRVALANPNDAFADVSFYLTDRDGRRVGSGRLVVPPHDHVAEFVDAAPFHAGPSFVGTLTYQSSLPLAAAVMRGLTNLRGERLMTPLPVVALSSASRAMAPVDGGGIPYVTVGDGWSTDAILVNPTDLEITGTVFVSDQSGQPFVVETPDGSGSRFGYRIPGGGAWRLAAMDAGMQRRGLIRIDPDANSDRPVGFAVMSFTPQGTTLSEVSVVPVPDSSAARVVVAGGAFEASEGGSLQTSIVISNMDSDSPARVSFELTTLDGQSLGVRGVLEVPGRGRASMPVNGIPGFEALPSSLTGVLRMTSSTPVTVVGFQERHDARGVFLVTTLPAITEDERATSQFVVFSSRR